LVCYEIIFPNQVVDQSSRPDWILNVTNDGWFGLSAGPYQHFALAVLRAIEQGLPVVRAANTGISGVVDPYGHVVAQIGLGHKGVLDVYLPQPLVKTLYSRCGDWVPMLMAVVFVLLAFIQSRMWKNLQRSVL
jgi:apolipoprotein N-acyltransferase